MRFLSPTSCCDLCRVDHKKLYLLADNFFLDRTRQIIPDLIGAIGAVKEEGGAGRRESQYVLSLQELELMASDEIRRADEIGRPDRLRPKAQVRHRLRTGFVRIVDEIPLGIEAGILGDDFYAVLVGPHRAVGTEAIEQRAADAGRLEVEAGVDGEARSARRRRVMPTVKPVRGFSPLRWSNTAHAIAGVKSFDDRP